MDNSLQLQAILWDFGGVFTTSPFENFNKLEAELGAPRDFIRQVNSTNPDKTAWAQFESYSVSLDDLMWFLLTNQRRWDSGSMEKRSSMSLAEI